MEEITNLQVIKNQRIVFLLFNNNENAMEMYRYFY